MQNLVEALGYGETGIILTAKFDSEVISLADAAAFFTFLNESFEASLRYAFPQMDVGRPWSPITTNVSVESGSIKAVIAVLKARDFQLGVAASLTASLIWAAATHMWPDNVGVDTNVPVPDTVFRIPVDPQLTEMTQSLSASGKPWSIELESRDPRYSKDLKVVIKGNQLSN